MKQPEDSQRVCSKPSRLFYLCPMPEKKAQIAVIGGGAAGVFAAIQAARKGAAVTLFEKSNQLLSKVKVSGGGRCNITHDCPQVGRLVKFYPRGGKALRKGFERFGPTDTLNWFQERGLATKVEEDGRIFPVTDSSQTVIDLLLREMENLGVQIQTKTAVKAVVPQAGRFQLQGASESWGTFDKAIVATGGHSKAASYQWLQDLGLQVEQPIPSLFTFNVPDSDLKDLQGIAMEKAQVQVPGTKWKQEGPLLITHWGFSAPAVIKMSAWQAIDFFERSYQFSLLVNFTGRGEEEVRQVLMGFKREQGAKQWRNLKSFGLAQRLWDRLAEKAGLALDLRADATADKSINRFVEILVRAPYAVKGKTTFKEEFVTCGGVALTEVDKVNFESKKYPGMFLVGEVLNVDGLTGGFNFQHAWTSGYLAGKAAAQPSF